MGYDKDLLKSWLNDCGDYPEECDDTPEEELALFYIRDCIEINRRIDYCKKLLPQHKDALIYYTLAILYRTYDFDPNGNLLYKRPVRYYCIMAIRKDRCYASAWSLLAEAYHWVFLVAGEVAKVWPAYLVTGEYSKNKKEQIKYIEKALFCVNKALQIEPLNEEYLNMLKYYYGIRNEIYAAGKIE